jgi:two-component system chemotaxis response regulator CheB
LSGVLDDGVRGLAAIRSRGGATIGQSTDDALFPAMPTAARSAGVLDHQVAAADMGAVLRKLSHRDIPGIEDIEDIAQRNVQADSKAEAGMELENRIAMSSRFSTDFDSQELGPASGYTCPDCNGSLVSLSGGSFRCRVGHAWSRDALLAAHDDEVDTALWMALRSLQEKAKLARQLADTVGHGMLYRRYVAMAEETERALTVLSRRLSVSHHRQGDSGDIDA